MTLWLAAAGLVVVATGLVLVAGRGGDDERTGLPTLPIGAGAGAAADDAGAAGAAPEEMSARTRADMLLPFVEYVPGEGLPALGGEAPAYRLGGEGGAVDADAVAELAEALGIEGEPAETDGVWHVDDGERALDVYGAEGSWSTYAIALSRSSTSSSASSSGPGATPEAQAEADAREAEAAGGAGADASAGSAGSAGNAASEPVPPDAVAPCPDPRAYDEGDVDNAGGVVDLEIPCEPPGGEPVPLPEPLPTEPFEPPVRPDDLPSEGEARSIALDLLGATGVDTDGAEVTVEDGITEWFVTVEPRLGGLPAPGLSMYVGVGGEGTITMASGYLADPEKLGDYPLLDTTAALERLNEQYGGAATAVGRAGVDSAAVPSAGAAEPAVEPGSAPATEPGVVTTEPAPPRDLGEDLPVLTVPPETALPPDTAVPPETVVPPSPPATTVPEAPVEPAPTPTTTVPAPAEVAVTDAELVLLMEGAWDGSGTYLVPGYRYTAEDQSSPVVTAVVDDLVEPPPADGDGRGGAGPGDGDDPGDGDLPVSDDPAAEPATEEPANEPDTPAADEPADDPAPRPAVLPADATRG